VRQGGTQARPAGHNGGGEKTKCGREDSTVRCGVLRCGRRCGKKYQKVLLLLLLRREKEDISCMLSGMRRNAAGTIKLGVPRRKADEWRPGAGGSRHDGAAGKERVCRRGWARNSLVAARRVERQAE
jgi:hypothetical protein